jgi:hypothetical protein
MPMHYIISTWLRLWMAIMTQTQPATGAQPLAPKPCDRSQLQALEWVGCLPAQLWDGSKMIKTRRNPKPQTSK